MLPQRYDFFIFALMKCLIWLLSVILIPLSAIDTLMQSQPDSALTVLLDEPTDEPYYQLLLSEALYKNDYAQTNAMSSWWPWPISIP